MPRKQARTKKSKQNNEQEEHVAEASHQVEATTSVSNTAVDAADWSTSNQHKETGETAHEYEAHSANTQLREPVSESEVQVTSGQHEEPSSNEQEAQHWPETSVRKISTGSAKRKMNEDESDQNESSAKKRKTTAPKRKSTRRKSTKSRRRRITNH